MAKPRKAGRWLDHLHNVARPALLVAPRTFLTDIRAACVANGVSAAVANHDSAAIFEALVRNFQYQGISDSAADGFTRKHGSVTWAWIEESLEQEGTCPLISNHWSFSGCRYLKAAQTCSHPSNMLGCVVPRLPLRKGSLNQSAVGLYLFIRDVCGGDLVGWIDERLETADHAGSIIERAAAMRASLLEPLKNIHGISDKILGMALADLLLGGEPSREKWHIAGVSFVVVDTLVHNFLLRTSG